MRIQGAVRHEPLCKRASACVIVGRRDGKDFSLQDHTSHQGMIQTPCPHSGIGANVIVGKRDGNDNDVQGKRTQSIVRDARRHPVAVPCPPAKATTPEVVARARTQITDMTTNKEEVERIQAIRLSTCQNHKTESCGKSAQASPKKYTIR